MEDLDGAESVLYPLREIKSKKRITKTVVIKNTKGETRTVSLVVEGPVSIAGCTTRESVYEDNANRSFLLYIDESPEQDERVMAYQRAESAGHIDKAAEHALREQFQNMQRILQPIAVRNPYAEYLQIPREVFKPRRTNAHYLAFIEVVTFYHQYQREKRYRPHHGGRIHRNHRGRHRRSQRVGQRSTAAQIRCTERGHAGLLRKTQSLAEGGRKGHVPEPGDTLGLKDQGYYAKKVPPSLAGCGVDPGQKRQEINRLPLRGNESRGIRNAKRKHYYRAG